MAQLVLAQSQTLDSGLVYMFTMGMWRVVYFSTWHILAIQLLSHPPLQLQAMLITGIPAEYLFNIKSWI